MRLISDPAEWAGELPAVLAAGAAGPAERQLLLRGLVAQVLGRAVDHVRITHGDGRAPVLAEPRDQVLYLSGASRGGLAVVAVARTPIGIDIEAVEPGTEPPWGVLHAGERAWLLGVRGGEREQGFARLWAAKEAYLKALGLGFRREPSSFAVLPAGNVTDLAIADTEQHARANVSTATLTRAGRSFAICLAKLAAPA